MTKGNISMGRRSLPSLVRICSAVLFTSCFQVASAAEFDLEGDTDCLWGSKDCNACVGDVKASFNAMETKYTGERGNKIRVRSYAYPTKNYLLHRMNAWNEHIQGIGRIAGLGDEEYFVFTNSTNSADAGKSGALAVVRMAANKNSRGYAVGDLRDGAGKDQKIHNRTVARTHSDSNHPGGLATLGHFVFVADWCQDKGADDWCDDPSQTAFEIYDVSNTDKNVDALNSNPPVKVLSRSVYKAGDPLRNKSTASVAATRLNDNRYLVGIGRSGGKNYEYFLSDTKQITRSTKWASVSDVTPIEKHGEGAAMVNECGSGDIYLIQMEKSANSVFDNTSSRDQLHLFKLNKDPQTKSISHEYIKSRTFKCSDGTAWCDFDKGTGIYVSPTRNLYLYATDAQQAKSTERFRMVEFGNYRDTEVLRKTSNASCSNANSTRLCANNGATCDVLGNSKNASSADVCRWAYANSAAACKGTVGIWTTPNSRYAKNHPTALASGSNGACLTEVANITKSIADELIKSGATVGKFKVWNSESGTTPPPNEPGSREVRLGTVAMDGFDAVSGKPSPTPNPANGVVTPPVKRPPQKSGLAAPSDLQISGAGRTKLTLSWQDNATEEFGVEVHRIDPVAARKDPSVKWKFIATFQERISSKVSGTGLRTDEDFDLTPNADYCYKVRSYYGFSRDKVSGFSNTVCGKTLPSSTPTPSNGGVVPPIIRPDKNGLAAPTDLQTSNVERTTLTLSWQDNAKDEFGVELYRMDPVAARQNRELNWEFIGLFEERVSSNVTGTGRRSDQDYELEPDTNYCYRLRAYSGFDRAVVSDFSSNVCIKTGQ